MVFVGRFSTLNYAMRAKRIQNKPVVQVDPKEQLIMNLRREVCECRRILLLFFKCFFV